MINENEINRLKETLARADAVLIGAGAKLIGNIVIGEGAKIGAGSVVLDDVGPHTTVAGVPARKVGTTSEKSPAADMNQHLC